MYEIDEVYPVIAAAEEMSGKSYGRGSAGPTAGQAHLDDVRMRVVADHVRSSLMLIGDGVRPGNDGRGYVLRRLIRRAVRSMRLLGVDEAALPILLTASKDAMKASYPELETNWETIRQVAYAEEDAFRRTLAAGTAILDTAVADAKSRPGRPVLGGDRAFALHDTYGFPIDLTLEMAAEQGVEVDEAEFRALMEQQKERARRDARTKKAGLSDVRVFHEIEKSMGGPSVFLGYTESAADATVTGLLVDGRPEPAATPPRWRSSWTAPPSTLRWAASSPTTAPSAWPMAASSRSMMSRPPSRGCPSTAGPSQRARRRWGSAPMRRSTSYAAWPSPALTPPLTWFTLGCAGWSPPTLRKPGPRIRRPACVSTSATPRRSAALRWTTSNPLSTTGSPMTSQ